MTIMARFVRNRKLWFLFLSTLFLTLVIPIAHGQYADQAVCNSGYVVQQDSGNDGGWSDGIEQTVCLTYTAASGLDSYVETDNTYSQDYYSQYGLDNMWTYGVSAEAQLIGYDASNNAYTVADSGMVYSGTDDGGAQSAVAQISSTPQQYLSYQLNGTFLECMSGSNYWNCSWQVNPYLNSNAGWSVTMQLGPGPPTVTWATPRPVVYGTALSATQLDASASIPGTYVYSPAPGTTFLPGTHTLSVVFTPTDTSYSPITASVPLLVLPSSAPAACFQ